MRSISRRDATPARASSFAIRSSPSLRSKAPLLGPAFGLGLRDGLLSQRRRGGLVGRAGAFKGGLTMSAPLTHIATKVTGHSGKWR